MAEKDPSVLADSELRSVDGIDRIAPDMVGARPPMPEIELNLRRDGESPSADARGSTSVEDGSMVQGAEAAQPSQLVREAQEACSQSQLGKLALNQRECLKRSLTTMTPDIGKIGLHPSMPSRWPMPPILTEGLVEPQVRLPGGASQQQILT